MRSLASTTTPSTRHETSKRHEDELSESAPDSSVPNQEEAVESLRVKAYLLYSKGRSGARYLPDVNDSKAMKERNADS